jgi:hypothetical protein
MGGYWKLQEEAQGHTLEDSLWKRLWTCCKTLRNKDDFCDQQIVSHCSRCWHKALYMPFS